jgi:hypothetical protein
MVHRGANLRVMIEPIVAGAIATIPMTLTILIAKRAGFIGTPSPRQVSQEMAEEMAPLPEEGEPAFQPMWIAGHFAYGGLCGLIYAGMRQVLPGTVPVGGLVFGTGVWIVSYGGYLPALHLYPTPDKDSHARAGVMIVAHLVYGASLAAIHARMESRM